jgi:hypothetical protein
MMTTVERLNSERLHWGAWVWCEDYAEATHTDRDGRCEHCGRHDHERADTPPKPRVTAAPDMRANL